MQHLVMLEFLNSVLCLGSCGQFHPRLSQQCGFEHWPKRSQNKVAVLQYMETITHKSCSGAFKEMPLLRRVYRPSSKSTCSISPTICSPTFRRISFQTQHLVVFSGWICLIISLSNCQRKEQTKTHVIWFFPKAHLQGSNQHGRPKSCWEQAQISSRRCLPIHSARGVLGCNYKSAMV